MTKTARRRPRRSLLYVPGNNPAMVQNCSVYGADGVLLDLEDAVAVTEKDAARHLVSQALVDLPFDGVEKVVRINGRDTRFFEDDLKAIVPAKPDSIRLPKTESPEDIVEADRIISELERGNDIPVGSIEIHAMLETALALINAYSIATSSPRVTALTLGGQDLAADLGIARSREGTELLYARSHVILAAKAAGKEALDTVFTDVNDQEGLEAECRLAVQLGFSGKAAIHPSQIGTIHRAYRPNEKKLIKAIRVVKAAKDAEAKGLGVIAVDGKMVDAPVVAQANRTIELAKLSGMEVSL
ncbi:Citrate (pro-3S)-lyase [Dethiosulfovibrio peptidovorans DSM 11002]|uniref:Citrate (Pro-3S)-lyase n=1 Tax=Dethiosulfovibrio peptidovorans DSM 11002 TaxID=469381 RepID=D2Z7J4_9BACT|nr:aldolase/citrate lyase family protein [Dethiosulfovibrio peptidovorans]EFC91441.1 Citrate (pro-3S)-lyase [Dethiosulfovibrio peptidovorans DSM 11002]